MGGGLRVAADIFAFSPSRNFVYHNQKRYDLNIIWLKNLSSFNSEVNLLANKNNAKPLYASFRHCEDVFGIGNQTLMGRGCVVHDIDGTKSFLVKDILEKASDLLVEKLNDEAVDLKKQKTAEEVRKLKIENDMKEGILVLAADVEEGYLRRAREVVDVLDTMLMEIKKRDPDIPQSTLDTVNTTMIEVRNRAF